MSATHAPKHMKRIMKRIRSAPLLVVWLLLLTLASVQQAWGDFNPTACSLPSIGGAGAEFRDLDADGTLDPGEPVVTGSKIEGESILYSASLSHDQDSTHCGFEGPNAVTVAAGLPIAGTCPVAPSEDSSPQIMRS